MVKELIFRGAEFLELADGCDSRLLTRCLLGRAENRRQIEAERHQRAVHARHRFREKTVGGGRRLYLYSDYWITKGAK